MSARKKEPRHFATCRALEKSGWKHWDTIKSSRYVCAGAIRTYHNRIKIDGVYYIRCAVGVGKSVSRGMYQLQELYVLMP